MRVTRLEEMERYILNNEQVSMESLCEKFCVSMITARRDILLLVEKGTVKKVYGGVTALKSDQLIPFEDRMSKNSAAKDRIARRAADIVQSGDVIFLDSGTTTHHLIPYLSDKSNITIITHNLHAIVSAAAYEQLNVIVLPGQLLHKTNSITGISALHALGSYNFHHAFLASSGVSAEFHVTNSSPLEFEMKKMAMARSRKRTLMVDSDKFGRSAMLTYARLQDFDLVVTDQAPSAAYIAAIKSEHRNLLLADE